MKFITSLQQKFVTVWPLLGERTQRIVAANEAMTFGYGGISTVSRASRVLRVKPSLFIRLFTSISLFHTVISNRILSYSIEGEFSLFDFFFSMRPIWARYFTSSATFLISRFAMLAS